MSRSYDDLDELSFKELKDYIIELENTVDDLLRKTTNNSWNEYQKNYYHTHIKQKKYHCDICNKDICENYRKKHDQRMHPDKV